MFMCVEKKKQMNNCIGFIKNRDFQQAYTPMFELEEFERTASIFC